MSRRRWTIWLGPPIALVAIALARAGFQAGAEAGGRETAQAAGACTASPLQKDAHGKPSLGAGQGTWWALTGRVDANGALAGRRLAIGRAGSANLGLELASDSLASGPLAGIVALTTDDGRHSEIRVVSEAQGCAFLVASTPKLARGAIVNPSDGSLLAHLIDRASRADLGTWRYAPEGTGDPAMIAPPLPLDPQRGPIWTTDLHLDEAGSLLAVQSCTDSGCLTRVFDLEKGLVPVATLEGDQGSLIALTSESAITWEQCDGFPCGIRQWSLLTGDSVTLVQRAESAAVSANGRFLVAVADSSSGGSIRVDLQHGDVKAVRGVNRNERLVVGGVLGIAGIEVPSDEVGLAADGTIPRPFSPAGAEVLP